MLFFSKNTWLKLTHHQSGDKIQLFVLQILVCFLSRNVFSVWEQHLALCLLQEKAPAEACWVLYHQPGRERPGPDRVPLPDGHYVQFLPQVHTPAKSEHLQIKAKSSTLTTWERWRSPTRAIGEMASRLLFYSFFSDCLHLYARASFPSLVPALT